MTTLKKDGSILGPIAIVFIVLVTIIGLAQEGHEFKTRLEDSTSITAECEIINKYDKLTSVKPAVKSFYYEVDYTLPNGEHYTEKIKTSRTFYNSIDVGDSIECKIIYDNNGIFYLKPMEETE